MKEVLQKKLFQKYPKIFTQRTLSPSETCMCWGICTGDGWYDLLDHLCDAIQFLIDHNRHLISHQLETRQVKEKFGKLRFYYEWKKLNDKIAEEEKQNWLSKLSFFKKILAKLHFLKYKLPQEERLMNEIEGMISFAEILSGTICEVCGEKGEPTGRSWISTLCKQHKLEIEKKEKSKIQNDDKQ